MIERDERRRVSEYLDTRMGALGVGTNTVGRQGTLNIKIRSSLKESGLVHKKRSSPGR